ncbi:proline-rich protein 2-like [Labeo rohita]|uniref:proline-rich protein 2-like n=1 Tax=Labeo rohita TaxID=84645 RepID=UPI0021E1FCC5|nr:proline-rich protein 2-like [Labeo rohita]
MEETRAQTSGCPRARESQENHRRDNRGPHPEKGRGGPGGGSSGSHNADVPGGRGGKPAGSAGSRPHQSRPALGPAIQGPPPPSRGPAKPGGQAPPSNRRDRASAHPSIPPGARNHQRTGGRGHPPPAGRGGGPEMMNIQKWTQYPQSHFPFVLYTPGSRHHYPQRGNQRQTPELNPLHSGVETGRPPRYPAAAEKTTSPDPDRMASSSSQPPAPDKEQRTGVATRRQRSTTSPASQQHTRTPKPYLYVGVMEREKGSIRDGEEIIGGGKGVQAHPDRGPGPSRPGPRPIQTGAHGSPGGPPDPTAEEKLPPPHHSVNSQTTEDNRHPG